MKEGDSQQHSDISKSVCLKLDDIIYIYGYILCMHIWYTKSEVTSPFVVPILSPKSMN